MLLRKVCLLVVVAAIAAPCFAQQDEGPSDFQLVVGPRVGGVYFIDTPEHFSSLIREFYPTGTYFPALTIFGVTLEERILLGETRSHFAFQALVLVLGLEQGIAIPEGALLIGYRDFSGLEFGIGPMLQPSGISVIAALGWTFNFRGVYVPLDLSFVIPNATRPAAIALTTGFNFNIGRRE